MSGSDVPTTNEAWAPSLIRSERPIERAGELLAAAVRKVLARQNRARLAIPGGSALAAAGLARIALGEEWKHVYLTWVDERCVPSTDEASNRGAAARLDLLRIDEHETDTASPSIVLPLYEDGETPREAVDRVRSQWKQDFADGVDIVLLGMGEDGHIASLFPSQAMPIDGSVAHVGESPKPPSDRITLTRAALSTAREIILVVVGEAKRAALERLLSGDATLPAVGLDGMSIVTDIALET